MCVYCILVGEDLLEALENGVSKYPETEGRFPLVTKLHVSVKICACTTAIAM